MQIASRAPQRPGLAPAAPHRRRSPLAAPPRATKPSSNGNGNGRAGPAATAETEAAEGLLSYLSGAPPAAPRAENNGISNGNSDGNGSASVTQHQSNGNGNGRVPSLARSSAEAAAEVGGAAVRQQQERQRGGGAENKDLAALVFSCREESSCYAQALQRLVFDRPDAPHRVAEFGAGDGGPALAALLASPSFGGEVAAWELGAAAAEEARTRADLLGMEDRYRVQAGCFFEGAPAFAADCLVSNPPYLPAPDAGRLLMPSLHGGEDGGELTRRLLSLKYPKAMMMVSAYSNPVATIRHAQSCGYRVEDFALWPLPFGTYSSQPEVRRHITRMRAKGQAFYSARSGVYLLAGVLFTLPGAIHSQNDQSGANNNGSPNGNGAESSPNGSGSPNGLGGNGAGQNGAGKSTAAAAAGAEAVAAAQLSRPRDLSGELVRVLTAL